MAAVPDDAIAYAKEVYAAFATVGFDDDSARRLKVLLDKYEAGGSCLSGDELVMIAQKTHLAAVDWVQR